MSKTILMIHGFGAAGDSWTPVAASFKAAGYAVETPTILAELRTVGPPPAGLAGKTLFSYVAEISALARSIAERDGEKPVVFGHSMGGLIAQKLAEADLAAGLVLFAPASPADARGKPRLSPVFTFLNIALIGKPETKVVKIWKTGFNWGVLNQTPAARHAAIFATTVHDSGQALSDLAYPDRDPNKTVTVDSAKVTVPVLVLAGARDRTTPIDDLRLVAKKYGATLKEYANHAHWLVDEPGSDRILADVQTWLDDQGLGASKPEPKAEPAKAAAKPADEALTAEPKGPRPVAAKAKAKPAAKVASAPAAIPPEPKTAPAKAKTPGKASPPAKPASKAPAKAVVPTPVAAKPVKVSAKTPPAPKVATSAATSVAAVAKPKAAAKPAVIPEATPVAPAKAKPAAKAAPPAKPASAKAPTARQAAKAPATTTTGKSSPKPKA